MLKYEKIEHLKTSWYVENWKKNIGNNEFYLTLDLDVTFNADVKTSNITSKDVDITQELENQQQPQI